MPNITSEPAQSKKILDQVSDAIRLKHYSYRTEQTYKEWIKRYILFHKKRHPAEMGAPEIQAFLSHLAVEKRVAASTQNQALSAILFLYKYVLLKPVDVPSDLIRAEKSKTLPTVLTHLEAMAVIRQMKGVTQLMAKILYGGGLRLTECLRLRIKDIDFGNHQIVVRDGKGEDDRFTVLPDSLIPELQSHLQIVSLIHQKDLKTGYGEVYLPYGLARKYPNAAREWAWQYLFPALSLSTDPVSKKTMRHHADPSVLQKAIRQAAKAAGVDKPVSPHTFRHSFATELLRKGVPLTAVGALLGHESLQSTARYTQPSAKDLREAVGKLALEEER